MTKLQNETHLSYWKLVILLIALFGFFIFTYLLLIRPGFISVHDWADIFRPAALALLQGKSPYEVQPVFNPPWIILGMLPIALLPVDISKTLMFLLTFLGYGVAAYRLKTGYINIAIFLINPFLLFGAMLGNIDWLVPLGLTLPPQIGLFLVLAKPQVGIGIAIFWLIEALRTGGFKEVVRIFAPVSIGFLLSFLVFGMWPLKTGQLSDVWWNISLFPFSIPIGIALLITAIQKRDISNSIASGAFLSPYFSPQSFSVPIFAIIKNRVLLIGVVISTWIVWMVFLK